MATGSLNAICQSSNTGRIITEYISSFGHYNVTNALVANIIVLISLIVGLSGALIASLSLILLLFTFFRWVFRLLFKRNVCNQ